MPLSTCFCRSPGIIPPFLRAGPTEKIALELALCLEAVEKINQLWEMSEDEDKQGMARNLFSYITYDLDAQRIVDFRLKPWADRFVTLRAALYEGDSNENLPSSEAQGEGKPVTPTGVGAPPVPSLKSAVEWLLERLYEGLPLLEKPVTDKHISRHERNRLICQRYAASETLESIAQDFGISVQRVHQLIQRWC
jgi:hypothetical protein